MTTLQTPQRWQQFTSQDTAVQEAKLKETLKRAAKSPLYKKLWSQARFSPADLQGIGTLNRVPSLSRAALFEATRTKPNSTAVAPIGQWFLGHDRFDSHEWYPYGNEDFLGIASALTRLCHMVGLRRGDVVLSVVDTPPHITSFLPYLCTYNAESAGCGLEFINGSLEWYDSLGMSWITFIQKRRPTAILATKRNAAALSEKLEAMGTSVTKVLPSLRVTVFIEDSSPASPMQPYAEAESFTVYSPVEHMAFWSECSSHSGIHTWLDGCIPEILPEGKTDAQLLIESATGTKGELVLTNFASSLPLIRYKTGKHIYVESVGQCSCGANHPKISFRQ
jgi:phenylacetate-CoA ligase